MRRTLCTPPDGWKERIKELEDADPPVDGNLLLSVELALEMAWVLGCESETPLVVPALLSRTPMYGDSYTAAQRLAIANVRQITPYSASSAWRTDLAAYRLLPNQWRHYEFSSLSAAAFPNEDEPAEEKEARDDWEKRLLCVARKPEAEQRHEAHKRLYQKCLTTRLPFHEREIKVAAADTAYVFHAALPGGEREEARITFPPELVAIVNAHTPQRFDFTEERPRSPLTFDLHSDLGPIAAFLDEADRTAGRPSAQWEARLQKIEYRAVNASGTVGTGERNRLHIDGFHHAAGMVASGKSTLAFLIACFIIKNQPEKRVTLVVSDNQSVLRLVNQMNGYFRTSPETDTPVAVPVMGRTGRAKHLQDLRASADWQGQWAQNKAHWGERFLSTTCPLQGLIEPNTIAVRLGGQAISPGKEPCASLAKSKPQNAVRQGRGDEMPREKLLCPLYAQCPVHQATRDMFHAPVWITTAQAMTSGKLPPQAEARPVHIGEVVYEQSDLVIVDEADAVMGTWDEAFAKDEDLTNGKPVKGGQGDGIYDRVGAQTERFVVPNRASMSSGQLRWSQAQRGGQNACQILLSLLHDDSVPFLRAWVERDYFTPSQLFYRLSRRLAGLPEHAPREETESDKKRAEECRKDLDQLFGRRTPDALTPRRIRAEHERRQRLEKVERDEPAYELWQILRDINTQGDLIFAEDNAMVTRCQTWITDTFPERKNRADALRTRLHKEAQTAAIKAKETTGEQSKRFVREAKRKNREAEQVDTLYTLACRLLFSLTAALLDRHTYIIFAEWDRRTAPDESETQPHQKTPAILRDVLPLPPLGRQFGTYYSPGDSQSNHNPNRLSFLSYTNLGRWYLLHFHELFSDLRQRPGPNVLALSGTSYLPDAVRLHLGSQHTKPQGLLLPERKAMAAIGTSEFTFLPLRGDDGLPIRVSGVKEGPEKTAALRMLARKLAGHKGGHLQSELDALRVLAEQNAGHWADRARILLLVNSYAQAQTVAATLQEVWHEEKERIFYLSRTEGPQDVLSGGLIGLASQNALNRPDIETFGTQTNGRILVAPMSAIGRGYNILNRQGEMAAFGSLYFLLRPYPHPDDMTALARELNRRTLDWADNADFEAWNEPSVAEQFQKLRRIAAEYWDAAQRRQYWRSLHDYPQWDCAPRKDLAAYTAGLLVQAAGRLLRGGVPFRAYFVDAAFAMQAAQHSDDLPVSALAAQDAPYTSLLAAVIVLMRDLVCDDPIAKELYEPLADALCDTRFRDARFPFTDNWNAPEKKDA